VFGFFIAAACTVGLVAMMRGRYRGFGLRGAMSRVFSRLGTTPGQEQVIRNAVVRVMSRGREFSKATREARPQLAEMMSADQFEEGRISEWFSDRQKSFDEFKPTLVESLKEIHQVLDSEQRQELARWVRTGPHRLFFRHHHRPCGHAC
jgi:Spy/CpxP family protein refolding chaperone